MFQCKVPDCLIPKILLTAFTDKFPRSSQGVKGQVYVFLLFANYAILLTSLTNDPSKKVTGMTITTFKSRINQSDLSVRKVWLYCYWMWIDCFKWNSGLTDGLAYHV